MEISNIKVVKTDSLLKDNANSRLLAYASLTVDNSIRLEDLKIIRGDRETFLSFPSRIRKSGARQNVVYPISKEARATITDAVLKVFRTDN